MIILFEGVDDTGKTTIANELSKVINVPVYKNETQKTLYNEHNEKHFELLLKFGGNVELQLMELLKPDIIFDRSFVSEFAYARAFDRKSDDKFVHYLSLKYNALGTIIVYCYKDNIDDVFDDEVIPKHKIMAIKNAYELYFWHTPIPVLHLNTTDKDLTKQINAILFFLQKQNIINEVLI